MEEKKSFGESLEAFFAGKGFYIVLFLCVAVIGVSAWAMLTGKGTDVEDGAGNLDMTLASDKETHLPSGNIAGGEAAEETGTTAKQHRAEEVALPEDPVPTPESFNYFLFSVCINQALEGETTNANLFDTEENQWKKRRRASANGSKRSSRERAST